MTTFSLHGSLEVMWAVKNRPHLKVKFYPRSDIGAQIYFNRALISSAAWSRAC